MEQLSSSETSKDAWKEKELIDLMEKSLPNYVVNCFLSSGYDNTAAIVNMTTEGPENSLDQIEQLNTFHYRYIMLFSKFHCWWKRAI